MHQSIHGFCHNHDCYVSLQILHVHMLHVNSFLYKEPLLNTLLVFILLTAMSIFIIRFIGARCSICFMYASIESAIRIFPHFARIVVLVVGTIIWIA